MAVTVYWVEYITGESPGTTQHNLGVGTAWVFPEIHTVISASNLNFGNVSSRDLNPAETGNPVAAGSNSFSKYFRLQWSGSFTQISNAKIWKSEGTYVTGEFVWFSGNVDFTAPSISAILSGEPDVEWTGFNTGRRIPTAVPTLNNVILFNGDNPPIGSDTATLPAPSESNSTPGYYSGSESAVIVMQAVTSTSSPAGPVNQKTISLTYDRQ